MKILAWGWFVLLQLFGLIVAIIAAIFVLPWLAGFGLWVTRESMYYPEKMITVWRGGWLTWILGNEEDGVTSEASAQRAAEYAARYPNIRLRAYMWSAIRNSTNNLRWVFKWVGGPFFRYEFRRWYIQAGWYPNGFPVVSAGAI